MLLTDKYTDRIYGTITCYDRMIIQGYIPGWSHAEGMTSYLNANSIRIFDFSNFQTCRAACPPYVVPAFRHKQCMNPASLQFRLSLSRAILSMRISVHYRARRGEWRKTILSRKLICAVILFKHKQLRPRVRTLII